MQSLQGANVFTPFEQDGVSLHWDLSAVDDTICRIYLPEAALAIQVIVIATDINGLRLFVTQGPPGSSEPGTTARDAALGEGAINASLGGVIAAASTRYFIPQCSATMPVPWKKGFRNPQMGAICLDFRTDVAGAATRRILVDALLPN